MQEIDGGEGGCCPEGGKVSWEALRSPGVRMLLRGDGRGEKCPQATPSPKVKAQDWVPH